MCVCVCLWGKGDLEIVKGGRGDSLHLPVTSEQVRVKLQDKIIQGNVSP